jgi:NAD(P)-dependent dehydrogenase (short-subunit alcohol dehydrogenase family)
MVITVTGSTGTIGAELVRLLSQRRLPTRAVLRDTTRLRALPSVAWVQADLRDADLLEPALAGTTRLFLLSSNEPGFGMTQITGRRVRYQPISMDEARSRMQAKGVSPEMIEAMLAIAAYQKAGGPTATTSDKVERILGRPPRNIRAFARDYATYFTAAAPSKEAGQSELPR